MPSPPAPWPSAGRPGAGPVTLQTLEVGLEVTFAEGAEVAMQQSQVPGGDRSRDQSQQPEERAPGPGAMHHSRNAGDTQGRFLIGRKHWQLLDVTSGS